MRILLYLLFGYSPQWTLGYNKWQKYMALVHHTSFTVNGLILYKQQLHLPKDKFRLLPSRFNTQGLKKLSWMSGISLCSTVITLYIIYLHLRNSLQIAPSKHVQRLVIPQTPWLCSFEFAVRIASSFLNYVQCEWDPLFNWSCWDLHS